VVSKIDKAQKQYGFRESLLKTVSINFFYGKLKKGFG